MGSGGGESPDFLHDDTFAAEVFVEDGQDAAAREFDAGGVAEVAALGGRVEYVVGIPCVSAVP